MSEQIKIKSTNAFEISNQLRVAIQEERKQTNKVIEIITFALQHRSYLKLGYSSMFDWLTTEFKYSAASAQRRIDAARLNKALPKVSAMLETGKLTLTNLSTIQFAIRAQESETKTPVTLAEKSAILEQVEGKTKNETEKILFQIFPAIKKSIHQERRIAIDESTTRHSMNLDEKTSANLKRAKELLSHTLPGASDADIFSYALEFLLSRKDPLLKKPAKVTTAGTFANPPASAHVTKNAFSCSNTTTPTASTSPSRLQKNQQSKSKNLQSPDSKTTSAAEVKRFKIQQSNASCTYRNPTTGKVCGSRHQIEMDHIHPKGLGGGSDPENLRILCRAHNLWRADQSYSQEWMRKFRKLGLARNQS